MELRNTNLSVTWTRNDDGSAVFLIIAENGSGTTQVAMDRAACREVIEALRTVLQQEEYATRVTRGT